MDRSKRNENMTVGVFCLKEREKKHCLPIGDNRRMLQWWRLMLATWSRWFGRRQTRKSPRYHENPGRRHITTDDFLPWLTLRRFLGLE